MTGNGSGLGKQEAIRFAEEGVKLAICDINSDKLETTKKICTHLSCCFWHLMTAIG